ncbi:MAG: DUF2232 domain-containing protein [Gammaproteobacteria bacterium]|nr:DUF2232 domain-containing protein [Gammaproteobacteria bacterium]
MNSLVRKWGEQVIRSRQLAAGLALVAAFLSFFDLPVGWLSTVIIALITLQNGPKQGLMIMAWAILPAVAMLCLGHYPIFINIVVLHYFVVFGLAIILRKNNSWINVVKLASVLGMGSVICIYYFVPELQTWLVAQLTALAKEYQTTSFINFGSADIARGIKYIGLLGTGLISLAVVIMNLMTLFLARWWQSRIVPAVSLQKECYAIRIHYGASLFLIAIALGLFANNALFMNVLLVALMPFIFAGLSLFHSFFATKKNGSSIMTIFYILFLFLSPYVMALLSFMGWIDSFINFRKRFVIDSAIKE